MLPSMAGSLAAHVDALIQVEGVVAIDLPCDRRHVTGPPRGNGSTHKRKAGL